MHVVHTAFVITALVRTAVSLRDTRTVGIDMMAGGLPMAALCDPEVLQWSTAAMAASCCSCRPSQSGYNQLFVILALRRRSSPRRPAQGTHRISLTFWRKLRRRCGAIYLAANAFRKRASCGGKGICSC